MGGSTVYIYSDSGGIPLSPFTPLSLLHLATPFLSFKRDKRQDTNCNV